jgi:ribosomal protein S18 acetylase RimI-like enzyme
LTKRRPAGLEQDIVVDPQSTEASVFQDVLTEIDDSAMSALLAPAVYNPTPDRLSQICRRYRTEPAWRLLGCRRAGVVVGCIGIELGTGGHATIRHIAVKPPKRGEGIGISLIHQAVATFALTELVAETDVEAVEFYGTCGFAVRSLGEKYPGTERFLCTWGVDEAPQNVCSGHRHQGDGRDRGTRGETEESQATRRRE